MLSPAARETVRKDRLHRAAVLDLANYRHAWDNGEPQEIQDKLHDKACRSVAALRMYDRVRDPDAPFVDTATFWTLAERYSMSGDFRAEMRFPSK